MKKLHCFLLIATLFLISCSKQSVSPAKQSDNQILTSPVADSIMSVSWFQVNAGGSISTQFVVHLTADSNSVAKVELYLAPAQLRWTVTSPTTGKYNMYDRIGDRFPVYADDAMYYFLFTNKDGSTKATTPFQVY